MADKSVSDRVKEIVVQELILDDPSEISSKSDLYEDLGADSLEVIDIIMALEEEFNIELDVDSEDITTFGELLELVEDKLEEAA